MQNNRIMEKVGYLRSRIAVNIIGAIVMLLILFGVISCIIGLVSFTTAFKKEYSTSTYHMADTATALVNGDHLDDYLLGEEVGEYLKTRENLNTYCQRMSVSIIYVIQVDTTDYGRFISIFNLVNNAVDNSSYTEWELGYKRDTTNDEYRKKYQALYEQKVLYETVYRAKTTDGQHPHITTMVPVKDSSGEVAAILCIQRPMRELYDAQGPFFAHIAGSTILLALISAVVVSVFIKRKLIEPIRIVSDEATRFAKENTKGKELGAISHYEELSNLSRSIDTMETDMVRYIDNLTAATAERERISTELSLASRIQKDILPNTYPAFPERSEFDLYATMTPAKEVGGDFYDYYLVDDDHLCVIMADVSGKGVPAALFMMAAKIILENNAQMGKCPAQILDDANATICAHNREEMFITVWLGILEISTGKLMAANAGHTYPVLKKPDGRFEVLKDRHGLVLGGMDGVSYREYELDLKPGTKLFVYTDGVTEAMDKENRLFGTERMITALNTQPDAAPEQILKNVRGAVDEFVNDAEQFDDLTMLCLEYKGDWSK